MCGWQGGVVSGFIDGAEVDGGRFVGVIFGRVCGGDEFLAGVHFFL